MNRERAISIIRSIEPALRRMGATAVYLFGSTARNEATSSSDVDIFIDRDLTRTFTLIDLSRMEHLLEDSLEAKVDLTTRDSLHPVLKADIEQTAIRVL
jgi:predicted nucleotidyltransferase